MSKLVSLRADSASGSGEFLSCAGFRCKETWVAGDLSCG